MKPFRPQGGSPLLAGALALASVALLEGHGPPPRAESLEAAYLAQNEAAMTTMMNGMAMRPSGDVDRDFALMMIPHHQGAIDMATAELRYGRNERLRRIAQEIVVDQQQEIAAMRLTLDEKAPASDPASTLDPMMKLCSGSQK